jgi:hypothetical protein
MGDRHARTRTTAPTWRGRRGSVILGPTEHRVALYLTDATRHGQVKLRTVDLAARLQLTRSEAYRVTGRLRVLGLFGIASDPSGSEGGRRYWRTAIEHDGRGLDPTRHRVAWARVLGWSAKRTARLLSQVRGIGRSAPGPRPLDGPTPVGRPLPSFRDAMHQAGVGAWLEAKP